MGRSRCSSSVSRTVTAHRATSAAVRARVVAASAARGRVSTPDVRRSASRGRRRRGKGREGDVRAKSDHSGVSSAASSASADAASSSVGAGATSPVSTGAPPVAAVIDEVLRRPRRKPSVADEFRLSGITSATISGGASASLPGATLAADATSGWLGAGCCCCCCCNSPPLPRPADLRPNRTCRSGLPGTAGAAAVASACGSVVRRVGCAVLLGPAVSDRVPLLPSMSRGWTTGRRGATTASSVRKNQPSLTNSHLGAISSPPYKYVPTLPPVVAS